MVIEQNQRMMKNESNGEKSKALMTRDLLGGSSIESQELDLDMRVPSGWEKRLDLQSGKLYIQRHNSLASPVSEHKCQQNQAGPQLKDLKFTPPSSKIPLNLFYDTSLDLKLVSYSLPLSNNYESVCTLDKVKSALERAEKEPAILRKRASSSSYLSSSPSASFSSSSSSIITQEEEECEVKILASPVATGCPGCLTYVLVTKNNPKCPRCNTNVPFRLMKKPRLDLNLSI
ncbi:uncharacterized protein LOC130749874 [Lotus japonicus]|uniref:uncharacterized protein LOC130749874 n=1 Tax=Lotus japonicus TaxID=34305 RepID=UPI002583DF99|nr:uncharacterized protein LOC130749874 [Lotus japonicus]